MYDYVDGKSDWMAFGLPVEGEDGPFAAEAVSEVPTCRPDETAADVVGRLREAGAQRAVVVNEKDVVLGLVQIDTLEGEDAATVRAVMKVSPSTVRPSVLVSSLVESGDEVLVTTSDGRLLGAFQPETAGDDRSSEMQRLEREFLDTALAVQEHFGDRQPSEAEIGSFLRDRLISEGKSPEEADELMAAMDEEPNGSGGDSTG
ncbi:MAG: CBS domain-containing protein [Actinomycetota bacterium]|nr:CBS domain-containing protein [Actinomycetota bacterium]